MISTWDSMLIYQQQNKNNMPKNPGRVCTRCTKRLTSPCDGADSSCPYLGTRPRNLRKVFNSILLGYFVLQVIIILGLLLSSCESDTHEQIQPTTCVDRDTGYVIIFNRWAHLPDDTMPVIRIEGTFYENACQNGTKRLLLPVAPVLKYWKDASAASKFEKCKEK
jgi:hypothetical protein